jgi:probable phosphoglycerate mutase
MLFYLVRHGESTFNVEGRLQGQSDEPMLSPLGQQHAHAVARAVETLRFDAIYSSPLRRAMQTARPVAEKLGLSIATDDRLKEINIGIFQGLLASEISDRHPEATARWRSQDPDFCIPGGESRRELIQRAWAALAAIRASNHERVLVVAHGGVLAAAIKALLAVPAERNPFMLYNGSISQLDWSHQVKLLTLNQTDHLRLAGCELTTRTGDLA